MNSITLASILTIGLIILLPLLFHLTKHLGIKSDNLAKNEPFEGGIRDTFEEGSKPFNVKFFLVGVVFLIFDIEILFMFPWALNLREFGFVALIEMFVFLSILIAGLIYVYKSKVIKWT